MATIDRIKFDSGSDELLVWKFPGDNFKLGAQLIVNQSQEALFLKGGEVFDLFGPGTHTLSTANMPLLSALINLPFAGETPFTAEVWFVNRTVKRDLKWGTQGPVLLMDPTYNYPISVRSYGRWGLRIKDSRTFLLRITGSLQSATSTKIHEYFIGEIHQRFSAILAKFIAEDRVSVFEINAKLNELSDYSVKAIGPEFSNFGIELINFNVEQVSIPDTELAKFQSVFGRRMEIEQISKTEVGRAYTTMRTFDTLEKAAQNPSGSAGALIAGGLGLGVGLGAAVPLGKEMGQSMNLDPAQTTDSLSRLQTLKQMLDQNLITQDEFDSKKRAILDSI